VRERSAVGQDDQAVDRGHRLLLVRVEHDPVAIASRHITGVSTIVWGNDYPHAEGSFRGSRQLIAEQFAGVPDEERAAMVGGTLAQVLGFEAPAAA